MKTSVSYLVKFRDSSISASQYGAVHLLVTFLGPLNIMAYHPVPDRYTEGGNTSLCYLLLSSMVWVRAAGRNESQNLTWLDLTWRHWVMVPKQCFLQFGSPKNWGLLEGFCYNVSQIWKWQERNGLARTRTTALLNHGNNGNMSHTHKLSTFPPVCQLLTVLMTAESSMRSFCASIWYFTAAPLSGIDTDEVEQKHVKAWTRDLLKITVKSAKQKVHRSSTDQFFYYFDFLGGDFLFKRGKRLVRYHVNRPAGKI